MQNFEQVKDVIDYSKSIHHRLRRIYLALNTKQRPEREKMLLVYLIEQQANMEKVLSNFETTSQQSTLDYWIQFTPNTDIHRVLDRQLPLSEFSYDEIVHLADLTSHALVEFYREAVNEAELPKVQMIFENLAEMAVESNQKQNRAALFETM